jgi:2',3'-cyclic-nucleotide 2'-phosphodiesterase (5'-nucleotidase family)
MNNLLKFCLGAGVVLAMHSCATHYQMTNISRTRLVVDSRYDARPDAEAARFLLPYTQKVDSVMGPAIATVAHDMEAVRPESNLSNLLSDILVWASKQYGEDPVMGIYNMGGIRAALLHGKVTYGDVLAIAPFENKICFLTLTGEQLLKLFGQIAARGGEGVSHGTELVISSDGKLLSARLHGKEIVPEASYRIATIDYLAQGNDGMTAFKEGTHLVAPSEEENNTRFIITNYFKEKNAKGETISAKVEGRIRIEELKN